MAPDADAVGMPFTYDIERHPSEIIKVVLRNEAGEQIGRASLVLIVNEVNSRPYGLLEDVFVIEPQRRGGHGKRLVEQIVKLAKERHCYKLIATSRYSRSSVHSLYLGIGFRDHGKEFRMDF